MRFIDQHAARKIGAQLNREDIPVARCTVERLMRAQGLAGARRGKRIRTTIAGSEARAADLVGRRFNPPAPDQLWVTDFVRHEALTDRVVMKGHHRWGVAAPWTKLRAA